MMTAQLDDEPDRLRDIGGTVPLNVLALSVDVYGKKDRG